MSAPRTVTKRKREQAEERLASRKRKQSQPAKSRETRADRVVRAKQLYDAGRRIGQIAAEVGVCVEVAKRYLREQGVKLPRGRPVRG